MTQNDLKPFAQTTEVRVVQSQTPGRRWGWWCWCQDLPGNSWLKLSHVKSVVFSFFLNVLGCLGRGRLGCTLHQTAAFCLFRFKMKVFRKFRKSRKFRKFSSQYSSSQIAKGLVTQNDTRKLQRFRKAFPETQSPKVPKTGPSPKPWWNA